MRGYPYQTFIGGVGEVMYLSRKYDPITKLVFTTISSKNKKLGHSCHDVIMTMELEFSIIYLIFSHEQILENPNTLLYLAENTNLPHL